MTKISLLPADTAPTLTDYVPTVDVETGTTKKATINSIKTVIAPSQLRRVHMFLNADNTGGAVMTQLEANDLSFSGTPTNYGRLNCIVPMDYVAGTTATIKLVMYGASANNQTINYYVGAHTTGSTFTSWNLQNNQTTAAAIGLTANTIGTFSLYTIAAANLAAGAAISVAFRPSSAVTGTLVVTHAYLEYTASV